MNGPPHSLAIRRLRRRLPEAAGDGQVPLSLLITDAGRAGLLYLLFAVASVAASPLSGIPFVTTLCGVTIALIAGQLAFGRRRIWVPDAVGRRSVAVRDLDRGLVRIDPIVVAIERTMRRRWSVLTRSPFRNTMLVLCMICGAVMPLVEIIPFGGSLLAAVVMLVSLALIVRDGFVVAIALFLLGVTKSYAALTLF